MPTRRVYSPETKARIVLEIIGGDKSIAEASREYQIKDSLLCRWKDEFIHAGTRSFERGQPGRRQADADKTAELERLAGELTMQLEITKKAAQYFRSLPPENEPP